MSEEMVLDIFREALVLSIKLAGPLLLISMLVGLVIAILQAATQVHEQTLTFVPKALTIVVLLLLMAPMMMNWCSEFVTHIFDIINEVSQQTGSRW
ncbi:MAG: flagellar biosynthesis protein FliQ [Ruminococcus sp.]|nr:flagellar biosynthesis protein FliQ [Ruminococcus sp.]MCM1382624.1 flagellar biosynthesis protein FliQ [Muribaculaceae bacterium]MCM1479005.1 flagellar biosynthesis protein FliQ [Muribaculaceae bacterium]